MTLSIVLEIALGLALVYYILGLIVSGITTEIIKYVELRAKVLDQYLDTQACESLGRQDQSQDRFSRQDPGIHPRAHPL